MEVVVLGLLGGALALDATTAGQFMLSRPLVAGALTGWLLGDVATGLSVGAILEMYLLVSFPSGGARFPDGTTATVVAVAAAAVSPAAGALPLAVGAGLLWGRLGGWTVTELRKINGHIVPEPSDALMTPGRVSRAQLGGVLLDLVRGFLVTVAGVVIARMVVSAVSDAWPLSGASSVGLLLTGGAVSVGILLHDLGGFRKRHMVFVAGLALGIMGARFF
jgi:mannose/fructose/N-acetylgalactosamine-specific phosphotransferase system component IIC